MNKMRLTLLSALVLSLPSFAAEKPEPAPVLNVRTDIKNLRSWKVRAALEELASTPPSRMPPRITFEENGRLYTIQINGR